MDRSVKLLDVVALVSDVPEKSLRRGQVGTVVEILDAGHYEVEFCDDEGRTYALAALSDEELLVLRYSPQHAAE